MPRWRAPPPTSGGLAILQTLGILANFQMDQTPPMGLDGPLIVEQLDSTTIVGGGQSMHVDDFGNLIIRASA